MSHQPPEPTVATLLRELEPALPFITDRCRSAGDHLKRAFEEGRPLVVLNSGWVSGANHLIRRFLAGTATGISAARITHSCATKLNGLRELIRSIGFDPKDMGIADLEEVFMSFLAHTKKQKQRTLVVIEESEQNSRWVHDFVGRMVELQAKANFGLTLILSRRTDFNALAKEVPLDLLSYRTAKHILLTPFTLADTRRFIRWRIDAAETADLSRIMEFEAITLIHELCDGIPDAIDRLYCASLELADKDDTAPVSTDIVVRASKDLQLQSMTGQPAAQSRLAAEIPTLDQPVSARIVLIHNGATVGEVPLNGQRLSIGRSEENDLCLDNHFVSRKHAAVFRNGAETAIVDLDSRNGTYVNSHRIRVQTIADQDEISIGHHTLRVVNSGATNRVALNGVARNGSTRLRNQKAAPAMLAGTANPSSTNLPTIRKSALEPD